MSLRGFQQDRTSAEIIQIAIRLGLLAALIVWCFVIIRPFIAILAWGAVLTVALYPVYYHSYELGYLVTAQLEHTLRQAAGGLVKRPAAGRWLIDRYFQPGNRSDWASHIASATGEPLNVARFVEALAD